MPPELLEGEGQGQVVDPAVAVIAEQPTAPQSDQPTRDDVEDLELEAFRRAAEAENPGSSGQPNQPERPTETGAPALQPGAPTTPADPGKAPTVVPKVRFDQVYHEARDLRAALAEERGRNLALQTQLQQQTATAPAAPNPELAAIDQKIDDLARRFDNGEIVYSELKQQERALLAQRDQIREDEIIARAASRVPQPQTPTQQHQDLTFARETKRLEEAYEPYLALIPEAYFEGFIADIRAGLAAEGITELRPNSEELLLFRQRAGEAAMQQAQHWAALAGKPVPTAAASGQPPKPQQRPVVPGQPTAEQRLAKLTLQTEMPPSLSSMTASGGADALPTDAAIEAMTDEEIAALPKSMKDRILGQTS